MHDIYRLNHYLEYHYWIIGLHARFPFCRILFANYSFRTIQKLLTKHLKMFMLNDTSIGYSSVSIIHYSITLIVSSIIDLCFKRYGAILQTPQTITIELIYRTCINNLIGKSCQFFTILPKSQFRRHSTPFNRPAISLL